MNKKLRYRFLQKLAQTTNEQPAETTKVLPEPPVVPEILFSHLNEGFSSATVPPIKAVADLLNDAVHYASNGKENFQTYVNTSFAASSSVFSPDQKNFRALSKKFYDTFLNGRNGFAGPVQANTIHQWADAFTTSGEFNGLGSTSASGQAANKLPSNIKSSIQDLMNQIKAQNPLNR